MTVNVVIHGYNSLNTAVMQRCAFLNYVISNWIKQSRLIRFDGLVDELKTAAKAEHPKIVISFSSSPFVITITMPDEVYTLTQLKYSEFI